MKRQLITREVRIDNGAELRQQVTNWAQRMILFYAPKHWSDEQCEAAEERIVGDTLVALAPMRKTKRIRVRNEADMRQTVTNAVKRMLLLHAPRHWTDEQCDFAEKRMMADVFASFSAMRTKELGSSFERKRLIDLAVIVLRKMIEERR